MITGFSDGNFPMIIAGQKIIGGQRDAFVAKLNCTTGTLDWSTYLRGGVMDMGSGIVANGLGEIFVCGHTSSQDFPITPNAEQHGHGGGMFDMFIAKYSSAGAKQWATYYGCDDNDFGRDVTVTGYYMIIMVGSTASTDFPMSAGFQNQLKGSSDAALVYLNAIGSRKAATYYGGGGSDEALSVTVDALGNTSSQDFPTTSDTLQTTYG